MKALKSHENKNNISYYLNSLKFFLNFLILN
jgi:hypothetical protein